MKNFYSFLLVILFIIPNNLKSQELIAEIPIPHQAYKYEKYTFIGNVYVTPDEKYIVLSLNYKPSVYSIHDYSTLELVSLIKVTGFSYNLLYNMDKGDFFVYKGPNRGVVLMTSIQDSFRLGFVPDGYTRCIEVKNGENYGPYTFRFGTNGTKRGALQIFEEKKTIRPVPQIPN